MSDLPGITVRMPLKLRAAVVKLAEVNRRTLGAQIVVMLEEQVMALRDDAAKAAKRV